MNSTVIRPDNLSSETLIENGENDAVKARLHLVRQAIQRAFGFLGEYGYRKPIVHQPESELIAYWTIELRNPEARRAIWISYTPFDLEGQPVDMLGVSIIRGKKKDSYRDNYLDFELYLPSKQSDIDTKIFDPSTYEGSFSERIEQALQAYAYYLMTFAADIVQGHSWETGHYRDFR